MTAYDRPVILNQRTLHRAVGRHPFLHPLLAELKARVIPLKRSLQLMRIAVRLQGPYFQEPPWPQRTPAATTRGGACSCLDPLP